ncbi:MAG: hypothetical protein AABX12_02370 [Nanoarchaeota archaeon]
MEQVCRHCRYRYEGLNPKKTCPYCGETGLVTVEGAEDLIDDLNKSRIILA